jgi:hypothetical protein
MGSANIYRELNRRRHKLFGAYLAFWAWRNKVDCVVLSGRTTLRYLELERMQNKRINWLKDDLKNVFPYSNAMFASSSGAYAGLYLSRLPFPKDVQWDSMSTFRRVEILNDAGLKTKIAKIPSEKKMIAFFAKVMLGI